MNIKKGLKHHYGYHNLVAVVLLHKRGSLKGNSQEKLIHVPRIVLLSSSAD